MDNTNDGTSIERDRNDHIKIDHYSWPENSIYRKYDKAELSGSNLEKLLEEINTLDCSDRARQIAFRFFIKRIHVDPDNLPKHPSWNDAEFEKEALAALFMIIKTDRSISQSTACRLAQSAYAEAKNSNDERRKEIYNRILFELTEATGVEFTALKMKCLEI